jgi:hypothetical protein
MIKLKNLTVLAAAIGGIAFGAFATTALQSQAQNTSAKTVVASDKEGHIYVTCKCDEPEPENWTVDPLISLQAEETLEQSLYLSAVQKVRIERAQGDVRDAMPALEELAGKIPKQPLRNAVRRLLVDIALESGDARGYKEAEQYLDAIIQESLAQY